MTFLAIVFITLLHPNYGSQYDCSWSSAEYGVSFDLCDTQLTNASQLPYYQVHDERYLESNLSRFEYFFNVAGDVQEHIPTENYCYNLTMREANGFPLGYCDSVVDYECVGSIIPINIPGTCKTNTCMHIEKTKIDLE